MVDLSPRQLDRLNRLRVIYFWGQEAIREIRKGELDQFWRLDPNNQTVELVAQLLDPLVDLRWVQREWERVRTSDEDLEVFATRLRWDLQDDLPPRDFYEQQEEKSRRAKQVKKDMLLP